MKDQADKLREMAQSVRKQIESEMMQDYKQSRVIVVSSGKGGVGKSTLALNLAIGLCNRGLRVLLMDADLGLANIDIMLGLSPKYNLYHMVQGKKTLKEITITGPKGLNIIPGGSGISELANLGRDKLKRVFVELSKLDSQYDYMIVDTGAGISENVISFLLAADDVVIITTPEPTSITDAYGAIKSIDRNTYNGNIFLVVNRVNSKLEGYQVADKFKLVCEKFLQLEIKSLGYIVNEPLVEEGIKQQQSFIELYPKSPAAKNIESITARLLHYTSNINIDRPAPSGGIKNFFKKITRFWEVGR